ncbi:hypothetical protein GCM10010519_59990 [Streptomyces lactacystinicus]
MPVACASRARTPVATAAGGRFAGAPPGLGAGGAPPDFASGADPGTAGAPGAAVATAAPGAPGSWFGRAGNAAPDAPLPTGVATRLILPWGRARSRGPTDGSSMAVTPPGHT